MKTSRVSLAAALAAGTVLVLSGPAFAHVGVQPAGEATKGGYAVINFKVPNERDNASTTQLEVNFPIDQPLTSVMPQDIPGWTVNVEKTKLDKPLTVHGKQINEAVTKVTWSGGKIEPGKFQQFPVSVGKLPEADQMVFKAIQTYDNNEVVRWIEETKPGAAEPQTPAPVLKLTAAKAADGHHDAAAKPADEAKNTGKDAKDDHHDEAAAKGSDTTARALGIAGIVIGLGGVAFGVASRRRTS
ncbi:YcnI family protein [Streptomyces sp. NBC_00249]|uniref:YcnI family copper-binding membrane protein n=1 Tax=Streptomyces sp. NBC_00249 TaxID=2975690 RepID=UPI00224CE6A4|nr:YcnI family protein [Streptomyces sp. NBC_00249]MCX5196338.1 YcnI family protein [Streptomyces sp. NBC_00249]